MGIAFSIYDDEEEFLLESLPMEGSEISEPEIEALILEMSRQSREMEDQIISIITEMIRAEHNTDFALQAKQNAHFNRLIGDLVYVHDSIHNYSRVLQERRKLRNHFSFRRSLASWFQRLYSPP